LLLIATTRRNKKSAEPPGATAPEICVLNAYYLVVGIVKKKVEVYYLACL
jgi:hypothetical protein